ncbi:VOC family protein [Mesorhizobium sp. WSM4887]|uniref:VOC family protein n=1 Tax=Mesorhizobium sp. WSM4887 TaxID=3038543 RepID=UPI002415F2D0|nr:VOC family protein [Mesorhizobium sp. WSM4887]MDG4886816.1 VOC family protein [Mesorhizobium sp. WSM4887]
MNSPPESPARAPADLLPPITQIAYLVEDLDQAVAFWARHLSVGPFKVIRNIQFSTSEYMGTPVDVDLSIALAWRDGIQIELMQHNSEAKSVFNDGLAPVGGFHHVGIRSTDIVADEQKLIAAGMHRLQRNISFTGTETIFFGGGPGVGIVELIQTTDGGSFSEKLKQAALEWDGVKPVLP